MMQKILWIFFTGLLMLAAGAADLSTADFLNRARYQNRAETYGKLDGTLQYRKKGAAMEEHTFYLGILIRRSSTDAQLLIDGREGSLIHQAVNAAGQAESLITPIAPAKDQVSVLQRIGLKPTDLTLGFLFYNPVKELPKTRNRGISCRVLLLAAPDKGEIARVTLAEEYYFPLKVEFFADQTSAENPGAAPLRTLEIASFKKSNELYYAELINLTGKDWRSRVTFRNAELGLAPPDMKPPFRVVK
ncbi:MAG: hypothetical protein J6R85_05680 [Lentisphaeria bacterium]|nr:hypothetical protein [Lentisphaeria bacterium]